MAVFAGRIRVGLSHKSIEAVDHKLSGWRFVNDRAPCHQLLQFEGAPDAQHRPLRNPESRRETTAAPARGTRRFFVQRLGKHCLHQGIADRAWRARTRLIGQTRQALREEACAPFADGLRRNVQALGALAIGATGLATEHDPCSHRQRSPALTTPRPLLELLLLVACQGQGLQFCARLHRAFGERTAHPGRQVRTRAGITCVSGAHAARECGQHKGTARRRSDALPDGSPVKLRNPCRGTDGRLRSCKPLKLRAFAPTRTGWPREALSSHDDAPRYPHDQGLDSQGLRLSRAADRCSHCAGARLHRNTGRGGARHHPRGG